MGNRLIAGAGLAWEVLVEASFTAETGTRVGSSWVTIASGQTVALATPQITFQYGSGNNLTYRVRATASGVGISSFPTDWEINGNFVPGNFGLELDVLQTVPPGPGRVAITVVDPDGPDFTATTDVFFPKAPVLNEQSPQKLTSGVRRPGRLYAADALSGFVFPPGHARRDNGIIVIIHGLTDEVQSESQWMAEMAEAIENNLGAGATPNIILYDWREDAMALRSTVDPGPWAAELASELFPPGSGFVGSLNLAIGASFVSKAYAGSAFLWLVDLLSVRPLGEAHGIALGNYLSERIGALDIDESKPIHLIGHSAGGFVAANAAVRLLARRNPTKLQVTTLDTPMLQASRVLYIKGNGGKIDCYVSSIFGNIAPGIHAVNNLPAFSKLLLSPLGGVGLLIDTSPLIQFGANYHFGKDKYTRSSNPVVNHNHSRDWYIDTIEDPDFFSEGFYYSPFLNNSFPSSALGAVALAQPAAPIVSAVTLTGFSTFGNVTESNGLFTLTEQGNAGMFANITFPMNASILRFNIRFTQPGDGDFLTVSLGNRSVLAEIPDGDALRGGSVRIEIPVVHLGGESGQLLLKLFGVGQDNAVVQIDSIEIVTDDDADHDGLSFAQETALGTDPRFADTDADGLSDLAEVNIHLTNPLSSDSDGDGSLDADELTAGTSPLDPKSTFKIVSIARTPGGNVALSWSAVAGKTYRVARSATLSFENSDVIVAGVEPVGNFASFTDSDPTPGGAMMFYRVEVDSVVNAVVEDSDGDGLSDTQEVTLGTNPLKYDTDGDGLGDGTEMNVQHSNPLRADTDGDGASDWAELVAGTDLANAASVFAITNIARNADGSVTLQWTGVAGRTYWVQRSTTPDFSSYQTAVSAWPGTTPVTSFTDTPIDVTSTFYRVVVE